MTPFIVIVPKLAAGGFIMNPTAPVGTVTAAKVAIAKLCVVVLATLVALEIIAGAMAVLPVSKPVFVPVTVIVAKTGITYRLPE